MPPCSNTLSESYHEKGTLVCHIQINFTDMSCQFTIGNIFVIPPFLRPLVLVLN